jgi:hypothetical protein
MIYFQKKKAPNPARRWTLVTYVGVSLGYTNAEPTSEDSVRSRKESPPPKLYSFFSQQDFAANYKMG